VLFVIFFLILYFQQSQLTQKNMIKTTIIALLLIEVIFSSQVLFDSWIAKHDKNYQSLEEKQNRYQIWKANGDYIQKHNLLYQHNLVSYNLAMNEFGYLTGDEFARFALKSNLLERKGYTSVALEGKRSEIDIPDSFDWRAKNVVPGVVDQGQCGSAVLFAEGHAIEAAYTIGTGKVIRIDYEQLAACMANGCNGAPAFACYYYVEKCGAPNTQDYYKKECQYNATLSLPIIDGHVLVQSGDEVALANALYNNGPHSVGVDASHSSFQFYSSGIYYEPSCSPTQIDHEMLLVGYGIQSGSKFWIVQNSWGVNWGMNGYINMARERNNNCGIASFAAHPTLGSDTFNPDDSCRGGF